MLKPVDTPFPFGFSQSDFDQALRAIPTADLIAEIEAAQWLYAELADLPGDSGAVTKIRFDRLTAELARRQRIANKRPDLAPAWPQRDRDLQDRIAEVKTRWPIDIFCEQLLGCRLQQVGRDSMKGLCPLPGHKEKTPSFHVTPSKGLAYCQGCKRGGDVIKLTMYVMGLERFYDALTRLEQESGIAA